MAQLVMGGRLWRNISGRKNPGCGGRKHNAQVLHLSAGRSDLDLLD